MAWQIRIKASAHFCVYSARAETQLGRFLMSSHLSSEKVVRLSPGSEQQIDQYMFKFDAIENFKAANYDGIRGHFSVYKEAQLVAQLKPEKRQYHVSGQWMTEAGIDATLYRDLYIALGEKLPDSEDWAVRIYVKAFVSCLWLGGLMMGLGALIALLDKRYRHKRLKSTDRLPANSAAAS